MTTPLSFRTRPVAILLGFSALAAAQAPSRPQTPHPPFPYVVREVSIKTPDGTRLAGTLTIPKGATRSPAAVLAPGAGAVDRDDTIMGHKPFLVVADHLARVSETIDSLDGLLSNAFDALNARISVQQNDDMRKISAWVAIAAVSTLVAGVYGMNFENMPELTWHYGYFLALAVMVLSSLLLYRLFKKSGWL
jgi:hypothetical protein